MRVSLGKDLPDIEINVKSLEDGSFDISVKQAEKVKGKFSVTNVKRGSVVRIGERNYIVLARNENGATFLIAEEPTAYIHYGSERDYSHSENYIREYLNERFYEELCDLVGEINIIPHVVDLTAEDGTGSGHFVIDKVSTLDTDSYRKYRNFLPPIHTSWWTVTPSSYLKSQNKEVCYIDGNGVIKYVSPLCLTGVRPCFVLSADTKVDDVLGEVK